MAKTSQSKSGTYHYAIECPFLWHAVRAVKRTGVQDRHGTSAVTGRSQTAQSLKRMGLTRHRVSQRHALNSMNCSVADVLICCTIASAGIESWRNKVRHRVSLAIPESPASKGFERWWALSPGLPWQLVSLFSGHNDRIRHLRR